MNCEIRCFVAKPEATASEIQQSKDQGKRPQDSTRPFRAGPTTHVVRGTGDLPAPVPASRFEESTATMLRSSGFRGARDFRDGDVGDGVGRAPAAGLPAAARLGFLPTRS